MEKAAQIGVVGRGYVELICLINGKISLCYCGKPKSPQRRETIDTFGTASYHVNGQLGSELRQH